MISLTRFNVPLAPAPGGLKAAWGRVVSVFESRWVSFALILLLQAKVMGGYWAHREMTGGDTSSYFTMAWHWYEKGEEMVIWSPAYTAFYGSFLFLTPDPVAATLAHRLVIVIAATLLVLAVFRQLLPPSIAWLCAAWWACLPIVFNTMYEVHLFGAIPPLVAWLLLLTARGPWRRAAALAVLAAGAGLVRNELSIPTAALGAFLAVWEWRAARNDTVSRWTCLKRAAAAYAICLTIVGLVGGAAYIQSYVKYPELSQKIRLKHTVNMAQVYAFGYQQRHPEWAGDPWLGGFQIMKEHFGNSDMSLSEMIAANPRAVAEHFAWNLSLTPSGLQLLLFNRASGSVNPDYDGEAVARLQNQRVSVITIALLAVWGLGLAYLWRDRQRWWNEWLNLRVLGWVGMFAVALVVPLIIATQRPRPSYLFAFGAFAIAFTGMSIFAIASRWKLMPALRVIAPALAVALALYVPKYYTNAYAAGHPNDVGKAIRRMVPHQAEIHQPGVNLLVPSQPVGIFIHPTARYVHALNQYTNDRWKQEHADLVPRGVLYELPWFLDHRLGGESFPVALDRLAIDFVYLDEACLGKVGSVSDSQADAFVRGQDAPGWQLIDSGNAAGDRWRLYGRIGQ